MRYRTWLPASLVSVALAYWVTLPPDRIVLDNSCAPRDIPAQLSEMFYGASFWQAQQTAVAEEFRQFAALSSLAERAKGERKDEESRIESKMTRLSDREGAGGSSGQEQRARMERLAWLAKCANIIAGHLP